MRILITNGRIMDPANGLDAVGDLCIADGVIAAVAGRPAGFSPDRSIDAGGMIVCPGLVDLAARAREPGQEYKATIASECVAAAGAGITTLCCPPDTDPVIDTPAVIELIEERTEQAGGARLVAIGALTHGLGGEILSEMGALKEAGCVGVSNAGRPMPNTEVLRRAMEYAATFDLTVFLHPEDSWLAHGTYAHEGPVSTRLGIPGSPETAETIDVARCLLLIEQTGVRAHFCRLSTSRAADMIRQAQQRGVAVTADVAAHQLHLTDTDIEEFDGNLNLRPPLRTEADRQGLLAAVADGTIQAICSDHQPHDPDAKERPFSSAEPGISAIETLLPLTLDLVAAGTIDLAQALAVLSANPASILGLDAGTLSVGACADVCVFDPDRRWTPGNETMISAGTNTPFWGTELTGTAMHTVIGGKLAFTTTG